MSSTSRIGLVGRRMALVLSALGLLTVAAQAQTDPLPSWNDGAAKRAIVAFVQATTTRAARTSCRRQSASRRSTRMARCGSSIRCTPKSCSASIACRRVVKAKPELANVEPFKTVLSGDREAIARLPMADLEKILAATLTRHVGRRVQWPKRRSGSPRRRTRAGSGPTPS